MGWQGDGGGRHEQSGPAGFRDPQPKKACQGVGGYILHNLHITSKVEGVDVFNCFYK